MAYLSAFIRGTLIGASLIMPIGVQNAYILKQGITQRHVFVTALIFSLLDAILISLGVGGVGSLITGNPLFLSIAKWGGISFLLTYAFFSFKSALTQNTTLDPLTHSTSGSLWLVIVSAISVTLLNPHVYLDAFVLLGSIGAQHHDTDRILFTIGTISASFIWFFSLGYAAKKLAPLFKKPIAWKILNTLVGIVLCSIAISLLFI